MNVHIDLKTETRQCPDHGEFTSRNFLGTVWSKCPACNQAAADKEAAEKQAADRQNELQRWQLRIGGAGIPERFQSRGLDNFDATTPGQQHALDFARSFAASFDAKERKGLSAIFVGRPGTGKTHIAVGIGMHLLRQNRPVLFTTVMRAIRRVKDTWAKGSEESESQAIAALVYPELLILDEVGVQFGSEFEKNILFDVLNERYEKRRSTLLMSNLSLEEVKGYLGERIFDRMREDGGRYIPFEWGSHRGKA